MKIYLDKKVITLAPKKLSIFGKFKGLMFKKRESAEMLLFENTREAIHSFFVFFDFLVLWIDKDNKVVDYKIVKPWKPYEKSKKKFNKIIEIPINKKYQEVLKQFNIY